MTSYVTCLILVIYRRKYQVSFFWKWDTLHVRRLELACSVLFIAPRVFSSKMCVPTCKCSLLERGFLLFLKA